MKLFQSLVHLVAICDKRGGPGEKFTLPILISNRPSEDSVPVQYLPPCGELLR